MHRPPERGYSLSAEILVCWAAMKLLTQLAVPGVVGAIVWASWTGKRHGACSALVAYMRMRHAVPLRRTTVAYIPRAIVRAVRERAWLGAWAGPMDI